MSKSKKIDGKQISMIIFLVLVVVGFTVPIFISNIGTENLPPAEPRPCQTDRDCYLTCNDEPISILCASNLCKQNTCTEKTYYPYNQTAIPFTLTIKLNNTLVNTSSYTTPNNFFIVFDKDNTHVNSYSPLIDLTQILEKINTKIDSQCLTINSIAYCNINSHQYKLLINGKQSYTFDYIPQANDKIEIVYN